MVQQLPTLGQLERDLSQNIHKLYKEELKHSPQKITSKFFGNQLAIIIEDALTAVEQILIDEHNEQMAVNLNLAIGDVIKVKLKTLIEAILKVEVEDILFDSTIKTKCTGAIVLLSQLPQVRNSKSFWKVPKIQPKNEQNGSRADNDLALTSTQGETSSQ